MPQQDPAVPSAERTGGQHELGMAEDQNLASDQPGHAGPADDPDDDEDHRQ